TTGIPKGSLITRKAVLNFSEWYVAATELSNRDIYGLYTVYTFDMHVIAFYSPLIVGTALDIVPADIRFDLSKLNNYFVERKITHTFLSSQVGKIYTSLNLVSPLKVMLLAGEKLGEYKSPNSLNVFDVYGPTESMVVTSAMPKNKIDYSSVGKFINNVRGYILDKEHRLVPYGAMGELYLSGYQLAKGYLNRDKENKEAFFINPFSQEKGYERMYKTGDIVRYLPDGTLGFIGRVDSQVKIRGNRVELGEVEATIREIKEVKDVTVQTITNNNNKELVAYLVSNNQDIKNKVINYVRANKPSYMVPTHIIVLDKIPLNINGKVDKRALPKVDNNKKSEYIEPKTKLEKLMVSCISEALNIDDKNVGVSTNLLDLGVDSLSSMRLSLTYLHKVGIKISPVDILNNPSIRQQLVLIENKQTASNIHVFNYAKGKPSLIFVHPGQGGSESYGSLAKAFGKDFSFACIENYNLFHQDKPIEGIKARALQYVEFIKEYQPHGPYYLGGWSYGGTIAFEIAKILVNANEEVKGLFLLDSSAREYHLSDAELQQILNHCLSFVKKDNYKFIKEKAKESGFTNVNQAMIDAFINISQSWRSELYSNKISYYPGKVVLFKATQFMPDDLLEGLEASLKNKVDVKDAPDNYYRNKCQELKVININARHDNMMQSTSVKSISNIIKKYLLK
ncbi:MAG: AMP-binding protein, partial [Bacilli bacterium]|nr:AMP-binding protein [Bacilli bacterium]